MSCKQDAWPGIDSIADGTDVAPMQRRRECRNLAPIGAEYNVHVQWPVSGRAQQCHGGELVRALETTTGEHLRQTEYGIQSSINSWLSLTITMTNSWIDEL